jgi:hypothetical protein
MKRGDQKRISDKTGLHKSIVSKYFSGRFVGNKNIKAIENAIAELEIKDVPIMMLKKYSNGIFEKRDDILSNLVNGDQLKIANLCNASKVYVNKILNGKYNQNTSLSINIIQMAELMAAINIWKDRFCKYKSLL